MEFTPVPVSSMIRKLISLSRQASTLCFSHITENYWRFSLCGVVLISYFVIRVLRMFVLKVLSGINNFGWFQNFLVASTINSTHSPKIINTNLLSVNRNMHSNIQMVILFLCLISRQDLNTTIVYFIGQLQIFPEGAGLSHFTIHFFSLSVVVKMSMKIYLLALQKKSLHNILTLKYLWNGCQTVVVRKDTTERSYDKCGRA